MSDAQFEIYDDEDATEVVKIGLDASEVPKNMILAIHSPDEVVIVSSELGCEYSGEQSATALLHDLLKFISGKKDISEHFKIDIQVNPRK